MRVSKRCFAALLFVVVAGRLCAAPAEPVVTSVSSTVHHGYKRTRLPDGSFRPEMYALGNGGRLDVGGPQVLSTTIRDKSIDDLPFPRIAEIIAPALAQRGYFPSNAAENTDLLLTLYYGRTAAQTCLDFRFRDGMQYRSGYLGYAGELERSNTTAARFTDSGRLRELMLDLEEDRYFVILVACDFRLATKEKKLRPLWTTRFNVSARRKGFDQTLGAMAAMAAPYFGESSEGLVRAPIPVGNVEIKELIHLGAVPDEKK